MSSTTATAETLPQASTDWRLQIPERRRRHLRAWLWSVAVMTFIVMVVGGVTRLTQSGLSIVDWQPIMGVIPPLTEAQWQDAFDRYRAFPEYQQLRRGMSLSEFKFIFFWEYLHRLVARTIGLVFMVPFLVFAARRYFNRQLAGRALILFGLGALQGVLGWIMVRSGLIERPSVSHYRLAAHLGLAFLIFGYAAWLARDLRSGTHVTELAATTRRFLLRGLAVVGALLALQIIWGAFVAGLKAGFYHNTFPLMGGRLVPEHLFSLDATLRNFVENPIAVQWLHRVLGTILGVAAIGFFVQVLRTRVDTFSARLNIALLGLILVQYLLGVLTLILRVPVALGVAHQAAALVLFAVWLVWLHHVARSRPGEASASPGSP